jgi:hypothetical protein
MPIIRMNILNVHLAARRHRMHSTSVLFLLLLLLGCIARDPVPAPQLAQAQPSGQRAPEAESDSDFEASQTQKLLGVPVQDFPPPQGLTGFDELSAAAPAFRFTVTERPPSGAKPRASYETRQKVQARAPDGSVYEAYLGQDNPGEIAPGHGFVSTLENRRQRYGTHHGYEYSPEDVFVGKRENGRLKPTLFFRDVGSHTTAPHYLAIDSREQAHLVVADVNIFQDNRLDLYWVIGDSMLGKWTTAWLVDRRGFTSWSHPWSAAWGDKVHLLWNWCDVSVHKRAPGMGLFHVQWGPGGFARKVRIIPGVVQEWDAAIDPKSGRLLVVFSKDDGVYVISRSENGGWTRAVHLHPRINKRCEVSVEAVAGGHFVIRTDAEVTREWELRQE